MNCFHFAIWWTDLFKGGLEMGRIKAQKNKQTKKKQQNNNNKKPAGTEIKLVPWAFFTCFWK